MLIKPFQIQHALLLFIGLLFIGCTSDSIDGNSLNAETMEDEEAAANPEKKSKTQRILSKAEILTYFDSLIENEQIIVGQQCGDAPDTTASFYNTYVDQLADETGRHVGLIGADFGWFDGDDYPVGTLIDHWQEGGLVAVSWHADNPFVDAVDVYWETVKNKDSINLKALLNDAERTAEWISYRTELDNIAGALQKLRDAGVTVIWRPFHEMNGDFFWWGTNAHGNKQTNEADYKAFWIDLHNVLTHDYGLDNLIWTYSVVPSETWYAGVTAYYPGSDYVDLVGMDYYGNQPDFPHFEELKSLGKTIVMSEIGPREAGYGNWNMMDVVNKLKGKAAYFMQWHSWKGAKVAIKENKNTIEMMQSDAAITRDELLPTNF